MPASFSNEVVLVTGASGGIGKATAIAFARQGAQVILNYRSNENGANEALRTIEQHGGAARLFKADISKPDECQQMIEEIERELGHLSVLVNNAAAFNRDPFLEVDLEELHRVFDTNVFGVFKLSQLAARSMVKKGKGAIIHISSILAQMTVRNRSIYSASKGAIESLARAMALDLAPYNIRVNVVAPGMIRTEALLAAFSDPEKQTMVQRYIPSGHFGDPEDIAEAVLFLASDKAKYINGIVLPVDGALGIQEAGPR
ncbi:MAG: SDR family oxidoreductase [Anaerolineae bacterium]|nr:SDR family oxidoreductase [Anaerolineae bacterium]